MQTSWRGEVNDEELEKNRGKMKSFWPFLQPPSSVECVISERRKKDQSGVGEPAELGNNTWSHRGSVTVKEQLCSPDVGWKFPLILTAELWGLKQLSYIYIPKSFTLQQHHLPFGDQKKIQLNSTEELFQEQKQHRHTTSVGYDVSWASCWWN